MGFHSLNRKHGDRASENPSENPSEKFLVDGLKIFSCCFHRSGEKNVTKLAFFEMGAETVKRDKTRLVTYKVPTMCVVHIYDHQKQKGRTVFGPNLVALGPSEEFNTWSLSAGRPKKTNVMKCLVILLGNFCTIIRE